MSTNNDQRHVACRSRNTLALLTALAHLPAGDSPGRGADAHTPQNAAHAAAIHHSLHREACKQVQEQEGYERGGVRINNQNGYETAVSSRLQRAAVPDTVMWPFWPIRHCKPMLLTKSDGATVSMHEMARACLQQACQQYCQQMVTAQMLSMTFR